MYVLSYTVDEWRAWYAPLCNSPVVLVEMHADTAFAYAVADAGRDKIARSRYLRASKSAHLPTKRPLQPPTQCLR